MELAVPVWQAGLTQQEVKQIERVQRTAFYIILGDNYKDYNNALDLLQCDRLAERRYKLCKNFVKKAVRNEQFQNWFSLNDDPVPNFTTRSDKVTDRNMYHPVNTRTDRYANSPLPYLTDDL